MTQTETIPSGYKKTEIGIIPEDWEIVELNSISTSIGDGIHTTPIYAHFSSYYFVNGNNLFQGRIKINQDTKCVNKKEYELFKKPLDNNTILMSINGTIGNLAFYNNEKIILGKSAAYIKITPKVDIKYLYYILQHDSVKNFYDDELTGTTINNLSLRSIRLTPIALPHKKSEQKAIAEVLSDTDALIESLEKLIAKKKAIKQGAMQQLLTGKKRLPGFSGEWQAKKLGKVGVFKGGSGFPIKYQDKKEGKYPFYKVSDMNNKNNKIFMWDSNNWINDNIRKIVGANIFPKHTIIFAKIGAAIYLERKKILFMESCIDNNMMGFVFDKSQYEYRFLHYFFLSIKLGKFVSATALPSLNGNQLAKITFSFPKKTEQSAIANILSDMDTEIEKLEQKRDKYISLKQGMMQQLLTGKIRLVKNGDN